MSTLMSHRLRVLARLAEEDERTLDALERTARNVLASEDDTSDVACAAREVAALYMARAIVALRGGEPVRLRAVKGGA